MQITKHAYNKARDRLGWNNSTLDRMVERIYEEGITHKNLKGKLRKFVNSKYRIHGAQNVRVYGQNIYFFKGDKLITLYQLPSELIKYIKFNKNKDNETSKDSTR